MIRKKCRFFVFPRSRQALLGMPDTDMLNIMSAEKVGGSYKCCTNMDTIQGSEPKQETARGAKCYTNTDSISKSRDNKTKPMVKRKSHKMTEYFLLVLTYESDKRRELKPHHKCIKTLMMYLMVLDVEKAHFHCN